MPGAVAIEYRAEVHHLTRRSQGGRDCGIEGLVTLCGVCHRKVTEHEIEVTGTTAATFRQVGRGNTK